MGIVAPGDEERLGFPLPRDPYDLFDRRFERRSCGRGRGIRQIEKAEAVLGQVEAGQGASGLVVPQSRQPCRRIGPGAGMRRRPIGQDQHVAGDTGLSRRVQEPTAPQCLVIGVGRQHEKRSTVREVADGPERQAV